VNVSIIATVKNEISNIHRLFDSLLAQTHPPDEVVIVDGGSTDGTLETLYEYAARAPWKLKVISRPGANISQGRNAAIAAAAGPLIASTDAGVRLSECWLEELLKPFEETRSGAGEQGSGGPAEQDSPLSPYSLAPPQVVSGFFLPDPQTVFETALGATTLPVLADIRPEKFLPSSRSVAFTRQAWEQVNGYPEWLDYCEDLVFDFKLREKVGPFAFAPRAIAYFRPRPNLTAFARQYYHYARGDGKADLWRKRHAIRYATYLVAGPLLLLLGWYRDARFWLLIAAGLGAMVWTPYKRLWPALGRLSVIDKIKAIAWVPLIRITGDIAKMLGYPVGVWWRWRNLSRLPRD